MSRSNSRCGFSLLELILVIAVLIVFASLAMPMVLQTFQRQGLVKGCDRIRGEMGKARVRAMRTGKVHALYFVAGQPWFVVAPYEEAREQNTKAAERLQSLANRPPYSDTEEDLLPRGVIFSNNAEAVVDARAAQTVADNEESALQTVFFYPDGTAQDARVTLQNEKGSKRDVVVRGLTGTAVLREHQTTGGSR